MQYGRCEENIPLGKLARENKHQTDSVRWEILDWKITNLMVKVQWHVNVAVVQNNLQKANKFRSKLGATGNFTVYPPGDHILASSQHEFTCYMLDKKEVKDSKKPQQEQQKTPKKTQ